MPLTPTSISMRCTSKNLYSQPGAAGDNVNVQLQLPSPAETMTVASMAITIALASDQYVVGNYYQVDISDATALA